MLQFADDRFVLGGVSCFNCLVADRGQVEIGNKSSRLRRICAEKDVADTDIPVIHTTFAQSHEP